MVDDFIRKKIIPRRVDEGLFRGTTDVRMPDWNKPHQVERHFKKEENANWKIKCLGNNFEKCGQIRYLETMNIAEVDEVVKYWHPTHRKAVYQKENEGRQSFRGTIPNVDEADEAKRSGGKRG